ncbi:MAG: ABC transporter permease [Verrucomicrobia bacterium]|nr:ABC transporter permease [Verrucomicrobiota bacterium]
MAVPLKYNLRNLRVRWRATIATALGIALVVAVFVMVMALAQGLKATYVSTGDARNLMVMRKGSTAESSSQIERNIVRRFKYHDEIARNERGEPVASAEIIVLIQLDRVGGGNANVLVRGISPIGIELRPNLKLIEGRMFQPGLAECIVSQKIAGRFTHCRVGDTFRAGKRTWHVTGVFDATKTAYESEIWTNADEVREAFNRSFYGSVLLRPKDAAAGAALIKRLEADKELFVRVLPETEYYKEQTKNAGPIQFMGGFLAVIMSIGAAFAAMNTMYASVGARTREIGTLRVLGFRRRDIYLSFLIEAVLLALVGGILGCIASLPINGMATGTMSWTTFSEVAFEFRITGELLANGMAFSLVMGVLGGLLPARVAARKPVLDALRSI